MEVRGEEIVDRSECGMLVEEKWLQLVEEVVDCGVGGWLLWWWVALYSSYSVGCWVMYMCGWWLVIDSIYRLGCVIDSYYRALLFFWYNMDMIWLAIYSVGRVGDMRH